MSANELQQWSVKYRPRTPDSIIGDDSLRNKLKKIVAERKQHAILVTGPTGCGKTTIAKMLANGIARQPWSATAGGDVSEQNVAEEGGKDSVRALIDNARYLPRQTNGRRVMVLEEAHGITKQGASALLRPLEEPAPHVVWILVTDQPEKLLDTMVNRCYPIKVGLADAVALRNRLGQVLHREGALRDWAMRDKARLCEAVVRASGQIPRAALQILQAAVDSAPDYETAEAMIAGAVLGSPALELDRAANKLVLALLLRAATGKNTLKQLNDAVLSQDAFVLLKRANQLASSAYLESTGLKQPGTYYFNKDLEHLRLVATATPINLGKIMAALTAAHQAASNFQIDAQLTLLATLYNLHEGLHHGRPVSPAPAAGGPRR